MNDFVIYTKMMAVVAWTFNKVLGFPKKQRFVLGQELERSALRALRLIVEANETLDKSNKIKKLQDLNVELTVLRSLFRVSHDMRFISLRSVNYVTDMIDEVGKIAGAWQKKLKIKQR